MEEFRWGLLCFLIIFFAVVLFVLSKTIKHKRISNEQGEHGDGPHTAFFIVLLIIFIILAVIFSIVFINCVSGDLPKYAVVDNNLYSQNEDYTYTLASHKEYFGNISPEKEKKYITSNDDKDLIVIHNNSGDEEQYKRVYEDQHFYYAPIKDIRNGQYIFEYLGKVKDGIVIAKSEYKNNEKEQKKLSKY